MDEQMKEDLINKILEQVKDSKKANYYANRVRKTINSGEYNNLIADIVSNGANVDYSKLLNILISDNQNLFEIKTIEDLKNYEEIRKKSLDTLITLDNGESLSIKLFKQNLSEIDLYRLSCLERLYGIDLATAESIIDRYGGEYGKEIDKINNPELKSFMKALQQITSEEDINKLKVLLQTSKIDENTFDVIAIEDTLQSEYGKLYEGALFHIDENTPRYSGDEFGDAIVYDASQASKGIMIHVLNGGKDTLEPLKVDNYYDYWNREEFEKDTSCSFISPINPDKRYEATTSVTFGFVGMEESLLMMGSEDISSIYKDGVTYQLNEWGPFVVPEVMASKKHGHHDEFVYSPFKYTQKDGQIMKAKKQPDYIVVMKNKEGFIDNIELAIQAQRDFKNAGIELPIVFIDMEIWRQNPLITHDDNSAKESISAKKANLTQLSSISTEVIEQLNTKELSENKPIQEESNKEDIELKRIKLLADSIGKNDLFQNQEAIEILIRNVEEALDKQFILGRVRDSGEDEEYAKKVETLLFELGVNANTELAKIKEDKWVSNFCKESIIKKIIEEQKIRKFLRENSYTEIEGQDLVLRDISRIKAIKEIIKSRGIIA